MLYKRWFDEMLSFPVALSTRTSLQIQKQQEILSESQTNTFSTVLCLSLFFLAGRKKRKKDNNIVVQKVKWWNVITPLALSIILKIVADSEATRNLMWFTNWYLLYCSLFLSFHYNCRAKGAEQTRAFDESQTNIFCTDIYLSWWEGGKRVKTITMSYKRWHIVIHPIITESGYSNQQIKKGAGASAIQKWEFCLLPIIK